MTRLVLLLVVLSLPAAVSGAEKDVMTVGRFSSLSPGAPLADWKPMTFRQIQSHSRYALADDDGRTVLRADSEASASGLTKKVAIDPNRYPLMTWTWKVSNTLEKGDVTRKSGDDYAAPIYVTFEGETGQPSFLQRTKLAAIKILYGVTPPSAAFSYVWGNRVDAGTFHPNAYTDRCVMVIVESGPQHVNQWRRIQRNVVQDFRHAFGTDPPSITGIAIMTDTDNTGESATAWYGDIVFHGQGDR